MVTRTHPEGSHTRFVGHSTEIAVLATALDSASAGRGGVALLAGEPGIGKTRLADELSAHATQQGALVLWGAVMRVRAHLPSGHGSRSFAPMCRRVTSLTCARRFGLALRISLL